MTLRSRPWRRRALSYEVKDGKVQAKLLERHVLREIMDRLWYQAKIKVWQINQPVGGKVQQNVPGIPDLIGYLPKHGLGATPTIPPRIEAVFGTALFIEVKRPGGAHRPMQDVFIDEARLGGCCAFFAESWADVVKELSQWGIKLEP